MSNPISSASGGFTLAAAILFIFVGIANFTVHQTVPRHLRFVEITTDGLGDILTRASNQVRNPSPVYGDPNAPGNQHSDGDGLRLSYTWGLWSRCAGYYGRSHPQYCTPTHWAFKFEPTAAVLEDVPNPLRNQALRVLNNQYNSDNYFGNWSRIAFYFIVICACLVGLTLFVTLASPRGPGRLASLALAIFSLIAFISGVIGTIIWTAIAGLLKHQLRRNSSALGMGANYGNAIWLMWAIDGIMLITTFGFLGGCVRGRRNHVV